jgi:DNA-binding transcriptional LysR family regulator
MEKFLVRVDLNLLRILYVMLEEKSVTRAAERLFITQSAMSKSLQRLRELIGDPLFVRAPQGLTPTPRALELAKPLEQIFSQVEYCLSPPSFDPSVAKGRIRIATTEQFAILLIRQLLNRLQSKAPELILESDHLMENHLDMLAGGDLDFIIDLERNYPEGFCSQVIYSALPMLWCRKDHPLANKAKIDIEDICNYPQITFHAKNVTSFSLKAIQAMLTDANLTPNIVLDTSHLLVALDVLITSDALMPAPNYLSQLSMVNSAIVPRPISHISAFDQLKINLSLVQHRRTIRSPLHQWLAAEISDLLNNSEYP